MRQAYRQPLAVAFGLMVVTAAALGGAFIFNDDVHTLDGATNQYVERGEALLGVGVGIAVGVAVGAAGYHALSSGNPNAEELAGTDWDETHLNIYQSVATQQGTAETFRTTMSNYNQDTKPIALMQGKQAYVAALQHANTTTKAAVETDAKQAVDEYYSTKQANIIAAWNSQMETVVNGVEARDSANVSNKVFAVGGTSNSKITDFKQTNVTLANGSVKTVTSYSNGASWFGFQVDDKRVAVTVPNGYSGDPLYISANDYSKLWQDQQNSLSDAKTELTTFIDATYSEYQEGQISAKDFADPYLGARESPEGSQAWSMLTLASMGIAPPENASTVHEMEVTSDGETTRGMLMSQGTPSSGGFSPGETYNTADLTGRQMVLDENGTIREMDGNFTIGNVTRPDGSQVGTNETVRYREYDYSTSNMTELKNLNEQLNDLQAQIDARQETLRAGGGGPLSGLSTTQALGLVAAIGGALALAGRD